MTLKELEIFLELSSTQNVLKTAEKLTLTQSAVSQAIKSLENKLGEKLFDRVGKKLVLNERGRLFKDMTLKPYNELLIAKNQFLKEKISGILHISASKTIGSYLLPALIFEYLQKNPLVKIEKEIQNSKTIVENIKNGKIDIGFIENEIDDKDLIKVKIKEDELIVVSSYKYKESFIDELKNEKWLLREKGSGTREIFLNYIKDICKINIFMEYNEFDEAKLLLSKYPKTLTCVSKEVVKEELNLKTLHHIKIKNLSFKRNMYLIYHKNKAKTALFNNFMEYILYNFKKGIK